MTKWLSLQLPTLQEKNGAQNIFPDQGLNHRPLELDTTALPFYYSLDLLHMPPNQAIPHILNRKKSAISLHTNIKRGVLDYRPTHPEYNSKRGGVPDF